MILRAAIFGMLIASLPAAAAPWAEAGDRQLRQDIMLLKAARVIRGPVDSWPLPWAQIAAQLDERRSLPPHVAAAADRVAALAEFADRRSSYEATAKLTNDPALIRDFGDPAREDADLSVRASHDFGRISVSYGVAYRRKQDGKDLNFEPSYAAVALGNWALYGGHVPTWWGPGHDGALLFSTNARPFPKVGLKRLSPDPFDLPVLRWLGPWRLDIFAGVLDESRNDFDNPGVVGIRIGFEPAPGLEIGLNRGLQLCGRGRPCGFGTITDALIGLGDADNTGTFDEPGNQLAGFDLSYTTMIGGVAAKLYGEAEAEDEDGATLIDQFGWLAGVTVTGAVGDKGAGWSAGVEFADTRAYELGNGGRYRDGSFYNNFIYTDGYTYRGRAIGHSIDGDSRVAALHGAYTDSRNRRFYGSLRRADINRTAATDRLSATPERIDIATLGVDWPTRFGDIRVETRVRDDDLNTPGRSPTDVGVELGWRTRF